MNAGRQSPEKSDDYQKDALFSSVALVKHILLNELRLKFENIE